MKPLDISGRRFGRLVALSYSHSGVGGRFWKCRCDCGTEKTFVLASLTNGNSSSCGCYRSEVTASRNLTDKRTHGHSLRAGSSREYRSWRAMKGRCLNANDAAYKNYGGRGISITPRWLLFENFLADMGPRPGNTSLDRIDNNRGYEASNCRWATAAQQNANRRRDV